MCTFEFESGKMHILHKLCILVSFSPTVCKCLTSISNEQELYCYTTNLLLGSWNKITWAISVLFHFTESRPSKALSLSKLKTVVYDLLTVTTQQYISGTSQSAALLGSWWPGSSGMSNSCTLFSLHAVVFVGCKTARQDTSRGRLCIWAADGRRD